MSIFGNNPTPTGNSLGGSSLFGNSQTSGSSTADSKLASGGLFSNSSSGLGTGTGLTGFGFSKPDATTNTSTGLFGAAKSGAPTFGSGSTLIGAGPTKNDNSGGNNLFGSTSTNSGSLLGAPKESSAPTSQLFTGPKADNDNSTNKTLFGNGSKTEGLFGSSQPKQTIPVSSTTTINNATSKSENSGIPAFGAFNSNPSGPNNFFGASQPATKTTELTAVNEQKDKPLITNNFGGNSLFGSSAINLDSKASASKPETSNLLFGAPKKEAPSISFGASKVETKPESNPGGLFGAPKKEGTNQLFGSAGAGTSVFGASKNEPFKSDNATAGGLFGASKPPTTENKADSNLSFGTNNEGSKPSQTLTFGAPKDSEKPLEANRAGTTSTLFGAKSTDTLFSKPAQSTTTTPAVSGLFGSKLTADASQSKSDAPSVQQPLLNPQESTATSNAPETTAPTTKEVPLSERDMLLKNPELQKSKKDLQESEKDLFLRKSVEDVINGWKNELDKQVDKFNSLSGKLKKFEEYFQQNFDHLIQINDIFKTFDSESKQNLQQLKNISQEEDYLLNQLDALESILDGYLSYTSEKSGKRTEKEGDIYKLQTDLESSIKNIQLSLNDLDDRVSKASKDDHELSKQLQNINFENQNQVITDALNNFYSSLQNLKFLQNKVQIDIYEVKSRLENTV